MPLGVLGVSPYTYDCGIIPNSIAFTFAEYAVRVIGNELWVAYAEDGVHLIDLASAGLPSTGSDPPLELVAEESFDTLVGDSDTVVENYGCHPVGAMECEAEGGIFPPNPCPDASGDMALVLDQGGWSAQYVDRRDCFVYVSDRGTPDSDGMEAPSHVGEPPQLRILELGGMAFGCAETLIWDGCIDAPEFQNGLVDNGEVVTMDIMFQWSGPPVADVVAEITSDDPGVQFNVRSIRPVPGSDPDNFIDYFVFGDAEVAATTESAIGLLEPGEARARVAWAWEDVFPDGDGCLDHPVPFHVKLMTGLDISEPRVVIDEFDVMMADFNPPPDCGRRSVEGLPGDDPPGNDPVAAPLDQLIVRDCPKLGEHASAFQWTADVGALVGPGDRVYNMYRGSVETFSDRQQNHFTKPGDPMDPASDAVGFVNLPCDPNPPCTECIDGPSCSFPDDPDTCWFVDEADVPLEDRFFYYMVTSEKVCTAAGEGRGLEGPTGFDFFENERPMGGGSP